MAVGMNNQPQRPNIKRHAAPSASVNCSLAMTVQAIMRRCIHMLSLVVCAMNRGGAAGSHKSHSVVAKYTSCRRKSAIGVKKR